MACYWCVHTLHNGAKSFLKSHLNFKIWIFKNWLEIVENEPIIIYLRCYSIFIICISPTIFNLFTLSRSCKILSIILFLSFECPKSKPATHCFISIYQNNTWTIRCGSTQQPSVPAYYMHTISQVPRHHQKSSGRSETNFGASLF